ncbi:hypothetical protein ACLB2K_065659 [Fragaria x ananassa]
MLIEVLTEYGEVILVSFPEDPVPFGLFNEVCDALLNGVDFWAERADVLLGGVDFQAELLPERADLILEIAPQFLKHLADFICGQSRSCVWGWS